MLTLLLELLPCVLVDPALRCCSLEDPTSKDEEEGSAPDGNGTGHSNDNGSNENGPGSKGHNGSNGSKDHNGMSR